MSEKNKQIDRHFYEEVWNKGNYGFVDEVTSADYVYHEFLDEVFVGPESVKRNITIVREGFPDLHFTIEGQIAEGDQIVTHWTVRGTQKGSFEGIPPTGKQAIMPGITISRIADGKYVEAWTSYDRLGLLQQLDANLALGSA